MDMQLVQAEYSFDATKITDFLYGRRPGGFP